MELGEALHKYFRVIGDIENDNLPVSLTARYRWVKRPGDAGRSSMAKLMCDLGFRRGVEIGTHKGFSAKMWCSANPNLELTCIDPYIRYGVKQSQEHHDINYESACSLLERFNATVIRKTSMEMVDKFEDGSLDFVYIDGDHTFDACVQDVICWSPKVRHGGLVLMHDYYAFQRAGVMKAVDAYTHCHHIDPWYVTKDHCPTAFWQRGAERCK
jgi:predicted O-methyltransferase YrrM